MKQQQMAGVTVPATDGPAIPPPTLPAVLARHASLTPATTAIICRQRSVSYAELHTESGRTARAILASGLQRGSRISYLGKEFERYYEVVFACAKSGAVMVPINWRLTATEVTHIIRDSGTELVFTEQQFRPVVDQVIQDLGGAAGVTVISLDGPDDEFRRFKDDVTAIPCPPVRWARADDAFVQMYTSGTTGLPKGVVLAQRSFFAVRDALAAAGLDWIDWRTGDVNLIGIPGFHIGGLWWAMQAFIAGVTNVALREFISSDAVHEIREHGVTTTCVVPAMLQMMLDEPASRDGGLSTLRKVVYGGAPISETLLQRGMDVLGCEFAQIYGLTETGNTAVCLPPSEHLPDRGRLQAAGRPYPGFQIKIIDGDGRELPTDEIGEVCIRTPAHMLEYWNLPEATATTLVDGWIHTGDAGFLDRDGFVFIRDRIKDTIIIAGENVYPAEIENALNRHPAVREVAVVGIPHERWGEAAHAYIVLEPGQQVSTRALLSSAREHLADFKIPTSVDYIDRLPRNPSGKVLRRTLRDQFWQEMARQVN